jgi:hypothetical protein
MKFFSAWIASFVARLDRSFPLSAAGAEPTARPA